LEIVAVSCLGEDEGKVRKTYILGLVGSIERRLGTIGGVVRHLEEEYLTWRN
jgi:hypothetical protein